MRKITKLVILGYLYAHREEVIHHTAMLVKRVRGTYDSMDDEFETILDKKNDHTITLTLTQNAVSDFSQEWWSKVHRGEDLIFEARHPDMITAMLTRPLVKIAARMTLNHNFEVKGK